MASMGLSCDLSKELQQHGMAVDQPTKKFQCVYCGAMVIGLDGLEQHLGAIPGGVTACVGVPKEVRAIFEQSSQSEKEGDLHHTGSSSKKRCNSKGKEDVVESSMVAGDQNDHAQAQKSRLLIDLASNRNGGLADSPSFGSGKEGPSSSKKRCRSKGKEDGVTSSKAARSQAQKPRLLTDLASSRLADTPSFGSGKDGLGSTSVMSRRSIGRIFVENATDFTMTTPPNILSFRENHLKNMEVDRSIPTITDLKGWILEDELKDMENYVKNIRLSWPHTGCSVLLNGWTDHLGRSLISVIVDCPEGAIYLRSADVSSETKGDNALQLFLESVLEEVGILNVIQIVSHASSSVMETVSRQLVEKYKSLFWTVSANHCLELILHKFASTNSIKFTLDKAKTITKFIYSRSPILKLLKRHLAGDDLVQASEIKSAASFLTLEKFMIEQVNIEKMFASSGWLRCQWATTPEGKNVANLVADQSFWDGVVNAVKASIPVVRAMYLIMGDGEPYMGFIYETMDQIKETISVEFAGNESMYKQYWTVIDEVWNSILHSPLHAAGYFLNPRLHFTEDFYADTEVTSGLLATTVRMVKGNRAQELASKQVAFFGKRVGDFSLDDGNNNQNLSPGDCSCMVVDIRKPLS